MQDSFASRNEDTPAPIMEPRNAVVIERSSPQSSDLNNQTPSMLALLELEDKSKIPFEEAILSPTQTKFKKSPVTPKENSRYHIFDMLLFTRRHPYLEITTKKLPVGSTALKKAEEISKAQSKAENDEIPFLSQALKTFANMFSDENSIAVPVPDELLQYKQVQTMTVKKKYSTWTFPKNEGKKEPQTTPRKSLWNFAEKPETIAEKALEHLQVKDTNLNKEILYLIDNAMPQQKMAKIGAANSQEVELFVNSVFFSSYSHSDVNILVVPLQKHEVIDTSEKSTNTDQKPLLDSVNSQHITYNIIFSQRDFTILRGDFYHTDVFYCIKTQYPFFNFYARFLSLFLSKTI